MTDDQHTGENEPTPAPSRGRTSRPFIGPFTLRQVGALAATLAAAALLLAFINTPLARTPDTLTPRPGSSFVPVGEPTEGLRIGDRAPEFTGTAGGQPVQLLDLDGQPIVLADLRGRPVWINFWATWCPPCQEETPVLRDVYEQYRADGLELVAISVQETTADDVRRYADTYDLQYTIGFDATSAVFHTYQAFGLPTQLFLDRDGVIRDMVLGPVSRDQAASIIEPLLAE